MTLENPSIATGQFEGLGGELAKDVDLLIGII